ncbi:hypothetical protein ACN47E_006923 [Coniothyrium glycines]
MPRDLFADPSALDEMPALSRESASSPPSANSSLVPHHESSIMRQERIKKTGIHPFAQLLNVGDVDDCDWLEHAAFDPTEAASREKIEYRLQICGELCSGLFTSGYATTEGAVGEIVKKRDFASIDSMDSDRKRILLGHIISTKSKSPVVTDDSMDYPKDWRTAYQLTPSTGHNEDGQTVCLHSLCIHPDFAGKGFGQILLKSYVQRIRDSGVATRIALLCRERLIGFYRKAGFKKIGPSKCQYGGGNWIDMVLDFEDDASDDPHNY